MTDAEIIESKWEHRWLRMWLRQLVRENTPTGVPHRQDYTPTPMDYWKAPR
jgi:hypothetical protein